MAANTAPTFAINDGKTTTAVGGQNDFGQSVAVQSDGKILVAGYSYNGTNYDYAVVRYNANGSLDTTFAGDGTLTVHVNGDDFGRSLVLQPDGKIVVTGYSSNGSNFDFAVLRFNANGTPDTTFDGDGRVTTAISSFHDLGQSVVLQADGKIIVAGYGDFGFGAEDFQLVRYNVNGTLDTTFDGDGRVTTNVNGQDYAKSVALQSDGKIVVAGWSYNGTTDEFAVVRYNANGTLDTTFSGDGKVITAIGAIDNAYSVVVQPDGKILVAGDSYMDGGGTRLTLVRYNANGNLDASFDGDGMVVTNVGLDGADAARSVILQPDGKIVVAGHGANGASGDDFVLARYNANGSLDTTFDGDGKLTTAIGSNPNDLDSGESVKLQADGKIVVAGYSFNGTDYDFAVVRYNADGSLDLTFGPTSTLDGTPTYNENGAAVVLDSDVSIRDTELSALGNYGGASASLARHGGASAQDVYSATGSLGALTQGAALMYAGVNVGTVTTNSGGTLLLTFNSNATQARVEGVLESIAYSNSSGTPPSSVQIDWRFSDGNSGAQGTGGALSDAGSTTVTIVHVNDAPAFTGGPNEIVAVSTPPRTVLNWASTISPGPSDEAGQSVDFIVTNDNAALFAAQPVISSNGTLTYQVQTGATGVAHVTVRLHDNGGTANGGVDTSAPRMFTIEAVAGNTLNGGATADNIVGGAADETLKGLGGNDNLRGGGGNDYLYGGIDGDALDGGAGIDYARYDLASAGVRVDLAGTLSNTGEAAGDTFSLVEGVVGSGFADQLYGDGGANILQGRNGDDLIDGRGGDDTLTGGDGNDNLSGGAGNDSIHGEAGNDVLNGGSDNDYLYGGAGADALDGDTGFDYARYDGAGAGVRVDLSGALANTGEAAGDTFVSIEGLVGSAFADQLFGDAGANDLQGRNGGDSIDGRGGNDTLRGGDGGDNLSGGAGADALYGDSGADALQGGDDNDSLYGGADGDALDGGAGLDLTRYDFASAGVRVDLGGILSNTGEAAGDSFTSIEGIVGSGFADQLYGDNGANELFGLGGSDSIDGRGGNDTLRGGEGGDTLTGGAGADSLYGESGADALYGDSGADSLQGGDDNDNLYGGADGDALDGGAGFDYARYDAAGVGVRVDLAGILSNLGEAAGDTFNSIEGIVGSGFADQLYGGNGADDLQGRGGSDSIDGRGGNDTIQGGAGADNLSGGAGDDWFLFTAGQANGDTVSDFTGNGALTGDRLVFSGYGAGATFVNVDATHWRVSSSGGGISEVITFSNAAPIHASDYSFV